MTNPVDILAADRTISVQLDLLRHSKVVEAQIVNLIDDMRGEIIAKLSKDRLTEFGRARLNTLLKDLAATVDDYFQKAQATLNPSLTQAVGIVVKHEPLAVSNLAVTLSAVDEKRKLQLININVSKFDAAFSKDEAFYVGPNGVGGIGGRYERVKKFIQDNGTFEASSVVVNADGSVGFNNGRHRYAALRDASNQVIPVAMDEELSLIHI